MKKAPDIESDPSTGPHQSASEMLTGDQEHDDQDQGQRRERDCRDGYKELVPDACVSRRVVFDVHECSRIRLVVNANGTGSLHILSLSSVKRTTPAGLPTPQRVPRVAHCHAARHYTRAAFRVDNDECKNSYLSVRRVGRTAPLVGRLRTGTSPFRQRAAVLQENPCPNSDRAGFHFTTSSPCGTSALRAQARLRGPRRRPAAGPSSRPG